MRCKKDIYEICGSFRREWGAEGRILVLKVWVLKGQAIHAEWGGGWNSKCRRKQRKLVPAQNITPKRSHPPPPSRGRAALVLLLNIDSLQQFRWSGWFCGLEREREDGVHILIVLFLGVDSVWLAITARFWFTSAWSSPADASSYTFFACLTACM